jgi:hypothetical protein
MRGCLHRRDVQRGVKATICPPVLADPTGVSLDSIEETAIKLRRLCEFRQQQEPDFYKRK